MRISFLDNIKGFLIVTVVIYHYIGTGFVYSDNPNYIVQSLYIFGGTFQMPLFVFISGFLSKESKSSKSKLFFRTLLPYLIINTLYNILSGNVANLFLPFGVMWYLLALYIWRSTINFIVKIRYFFILSIVLSIISKFVFSENYSVVVKILAFTPFFIMGYISPISIFNKIRSLPSAYSYVITVFCFTIVLVQSYLNIYPYNISQFTKVLDLNMYGFFWLLGEFLGIIIGTLVSLALIRLIPLKSTILSIFGRSTFQIYLFHNFPFWREFLLTLNPFVNSVVKSFIYWIFWSLFVSAILSVYQVGKSMRRYFFI